MRCWAMTFYTRKSKYFSPSVLCLQHTILVVWCGMTVTFANLDFLSLRKSRSSQLIWRLRLSKYIHLLTSHVDNGFSQKVSTFISYLV